MAITRSLLVTTCFLAAGAPAFAQGAPEDSDSVLQEIVVTAQKRTQSAQDVGITMSVVTADALEKRNIHEVTELTAAIPNVQINYGVGQNSFNIRGIGVNVFAGNFDPPVAVHIDEVYLSKSIMTPLLIFDVDRVEALKGPQGTLFGRNTTGGALNFYSKRPTDHFEAGGNLGYDSYETVRAEGYVSGPLSSVASVRLSGFTTYQGQGYFHNTLTGKDEGQERKWALRGQLRLKDEKVDALLTVNYGQDHSQLAPYDVPGTLKPDFSGLCQPYLNGTLTGADAGCVRGTDGGYPGDANPYTVNNNILHQIKGKQLGVTLRVEADLDWTKLVSISSFQQYNRYIQEDSDGSPIDALDSREYFDIRQYSQELRFVPSKAGRWNYVLGAYFEHDSVDGDSLLRFPGGAGVGYDTAYDQTVDAFALFFHNEFAVTDSLSLIGGVRYNNERLRMVGNTWLASGVGLRIREPRDMTLLALLSTSSSAPGGGKRHDKNVSYKAGVEWKPELNSAFVDKAMLYANVSSGFRSGAFNVLFADSQPAFTSLSPEKLRAYEAGFKTTLAGRTLQLNGAYFHYDFKNGFINVDSQTAPIPVTTNAAAVKADGVELELQWLPARGLTLSVNGGWLRSKIDSNITTGGTSLKGNSTVNSPKWTFAPEAYYTTPLSDSLKLNVSANANYRTTQYLNATNSINARVPGYWNVGAQVGVAATNDRWAFNAWVKNLTKSVYKTYIIDLPGLGIVLNSYNPPRVFGGTFTFKY
jgi:iron complex outermembrane receptor protein